MGKLQRSVVILLVLIVSVTSSPFLLSQGSSKWETQMVESESELESSGENELELVEDETEPTDENETEPNDEDETESTDEDETEPTDEDETEPTDEDGTEPTDEDGTEPTDEDGTESTDEDGTEPTGEEELELFDELLLETSNFAQVNANGATEVSSSEELKQYLNMENGPTEFILTNDIFVHQEILTNRNIIIDGDKQKFTIFQSGRSSSDPDYQKSKVTAIRADRTDLTLTIRNAKIRSGNYHGIMNNSGNAWATTFVFDNVDYRGSQPVFAPHISNAHFINSKIVLISEIPNGLDQFSNVGNYFANEAQEIAELAHVVFKGRVEVEHHPSIVDDGQNGIFLLINLTQHGDKTGSITLEPGAHVSIKTVNKPNNYTARPIFKQETTANSTRVTLGEYSTLEIDNPSGWGILNGSGNSHELNGAPEFVLADNSTFIFRYTWSDNNKPSRPVLGNNFTIGENARFVITQESGNNAPVFHSVNNVSITKPELVYIDGPAQNSRGTVSVQAELVNLWEGAGRDIGETGVTATGPTIYKPVNENNTSMFFKQNNMSGFVAGRATDLVVDQDPISIYDSLVSGTTSKYGGIYDGVLFSFNTLNTGGGIEAVKEEASIAEGEAGKGVFSHTLVNEIEENSSFKVFHYKQQDGMENITFKKPLLWQEYNCNVSAEPKGTVEIVKVPDFNFGSTEITFKPTDHLLQESTTLTVKDTRKGTQLPKWSIHLKAEDLIGTNGSIPSTALYFVNGGNQVSISEKLGGTVVHTGDNTSPLDKVWQANNSQEGFMLKLNEESFAPVGSYSGKLTWSLLMAP